MRRQRSTPANLEVEGRAGFGRDTVVCWWRPRFVMVLLDANGAALARGRPHAPHDRQPSTARRELRANVLNSAQACTGRMSGRRSGVRSVTIAGESQRTTGGMSGWGVADKTRRGGPIDQQVVHT